MGLLTPALFENDGGRITKYTMRLELVDDDLTCFVAAYASDRGHPFSKRLYRHLAQSSPSALHFLQQVLLVGLYTNPTDTPAELKRLEYNTEPF